jgi:hypothetical protein
LGLSIIASIFVGVIVAFGTRQTDPTIIAVLSTFIVSIVIIATLDLSFKEDEQDPNTPRLR